MHLQEMLFWARQKHSNSLNQAISARYYWSSLRNFCHLPAMQFLSCPYDEIRNLAWPGYNICDNLL